MFIELKTKDSWKKYLNIIIGKNMETETEIDFDEFMKGLIGLKSKYFVDVTEACNTPIQILEEHCEFIGKNDCYVLLAVSRKKDSLNITNSQEIVFREVIKNEKDIKRKYLQIKAQCKAYRDEEGRDYPFYLYISLNARDAVKATFGLTKKINLWMEETISGIDRSQFFKKIHGHFYSTLMQKESKSKNTKYHMFDFDTKDEEDLDEFLDLVREYTDIKMIVETRNGYHIKVNPFNSQGIEEELYKRKDIVELKRDCNMFVEYINKEII